MRGGLPLAAVLLAAVVTACTPSVQAQRNAEDDLKCQAYGLTAADPGYAQCRAVFAQQRQTQQQNALNALTMHGAYLPQQAQPYVQGAQLPMAVPAPTITNCRPGVGGWDCYSQGN